MCPQKAENDEQVERKKEGESQKKYEHNPWTCTINLLSLSEFFLLFVLFSVSFLLSEFFSTARIIPTANRLKIKRIRFPFLDQKKRSWSLLHYGYSYEKNRYHIYTLLSFLRDNSFKFTTLFIQHSSPSVFQCEKDRWFIFILRANYWSEFSMGKKIWRTNTQTSPIKIGHGVRKEEDKRKHEQDNQG